MILAVCLCLLVFVQIMNRGYASFFGFSFFRVVTGSMEPTIPVGALILTREVPIDTLEIGDVVSFASKDAYMRGSIITHRVVEIETSSAGQVFLTTRGDANSVSDVYRVDGDNLVGKVIWISGEDNIFARILRFLSGGAGFFTCIALPVILIAVFIFKKSISNMAADIKRLRSGTAVDGEHESDTEREAGGGNTAAEPNESLGGFTAEEYAEAYARIRAELIEELKSGNDRESSKKE